MSGEEAFFAAVRAGDLEAVRAALAADARLVAACDPRRFGATALMHAVMADDRAMVDLLLDAGADPDQRSEWWAGGFGVLVRASDALAAHLLERGATLTPHAAAQLGMLDELRAMLDADPSLVARRGGDGQLPLHFARTPAIAELLLERGAYIDARDVDHESTAAQYLATSRPDVAACLVARGCETDPFLAALIGDVELLERLVRQEPDGVRVRICEHRFPTRGARAALHIYAYTIGTGCTLMHAAAHRDRAEVVRRLAQLGGDVGPRGGHDDQTPLHTAAWHDAAAATAALLDAGAPIDEPSGEFYRNEPIGWAIVGGAAGAVRVLLERGAALREDHRQDARAGAQGAFRALNRGRPLEQWREVARLVSTAVPAPAGGA